MEMLKKWATFSIGFVSHQSRPDLAKGKTPQCLCSTDIPLILMLYTGWGTRALGSPYAYMVPPLQGSIPPPSSPTYTAGTYAQNVYKALILSRLNSLTLYSPLISQVHIYQHTAKMRDASIRSTLVILIPVDGESPT